VAEIVKAADALGRALSLLEEGEVVAVPTETVYGLAGDATNGRAVARIFEAKGRPSFNPLIAHVASLAMAERFAIFDPVSRRLAENFWPGPLTLVLPLKPGANIHPLALAGLDTVALRMPLGFAAELIRQLDRPLAAPSANRSGRISATTARAVAEDLGDRITLVVDGGQTPVGVESTILKVDNRGVTLLRPGGITVEEVEAVIGAPVARHLSGGIQAPGMMTSHYAPAAAIRLNATEVKPGEALLAFGPKRAAGCDTAVAVRNLSEQGDPREAATNLFQFMNELDRSGARTIAVEPVPATGLGEAINDRLARAAAPREG
jgi:L-threonylcarbamoyladenylate synthase